MQEYLDMIQHVLTAGVRKVNRTGVATLSVFAYFYKVDLAKGYPLLTTKKMYFDSMLHELNWYLSGEEHIRSLSEKTKIWDAWADDEGKLDTAYGRFWRRYPVPERAAQLDGENWGERWVSIDPVTGTRVFDQIQYIVDSLKEIKKNPEHPNLRRLVVSAWHPANAAISKLPPCRRYAGVGVNVVIENQVRGTAIPLDIVEVTNDAFDAAPLAVRAGLLPDHAAPVPHSGQADS